MKWLFIIFLLLNVCYFGWELDRQTRIEVSNSVRPFTVPADVQKLVLLEELENLPGSTPAILSFAEDENANENEINIWRGQIPCEPIYGVSPDAILDLVLKSLCNENEILTNWFFDWLAHNVQKPWERTSLAPVFIGVQGTGKGLFF
ncbi:MAG: hypothetical protein IIC11_07580, partial [Proteobacteria bacterium]|nr:hypothetical protein [Pseudomonadota bacterium]